MLSSSTRGLSLVHSICYIELILPIALYGFQLWYFKGALLYHPSRNWRKYKDQFCRSWGAKAIAGLIPIHFHLDKFIGQHHLWVVLLSKQHVINTLLDIHHSKQAIPHCMVTSCLTLKQSLKVKSPIVNINHYLNQVLLLWQLLVTRTNRNISNKSLSRILLWRSQENLTRSLCWIAILFI